MADFLLSRIYCFGKLLFSTRSCQISCFLESFSGKLLFSTGVWQISCFLESFSDLESSSSQPGCGRFLAFWNHFLESSSSQPGCGRFLAFWNHFLESSSSQPGRARFLAFWNHFLESSSSQPGCGRFLAFWNHFLESSSSQPGCGRFLAFWKRLGVSGRFFAAAVGPRLASQRYMLPRLRYYLTTAHGRGLWFQSRFACRFPLFEKPKREGFQSRCFCF